MNTMASNKKNSAFIPSPRYRTYKSFYKYCFSEYVVYQKYLVGSNDEFVNLLTLVKHATCHSSSSV